MTIRLSLLLVGMLSVSACAREPVVAPDPLVSAGEAVPFDHIASATLTSVKFPAYRLILDQDTWTAVWREITAAQPWPPAGAPPTIDFSIRAVVLAAAGELPTQLLAFRIAEVRMDGGFLHVIVQQDWPAPRCGSLPVVSSPVHVVSIPRVATTAEFTTRIAEGC